MQPQQVRWRSADHARHPPHCSHPARRDTTRCHPRRVFRPAPDRVTPKTTNPVPIRADSGRPSASCRQAREFRRSQSTQSSAPGCARPPSLGVDGGISRAVHCRRSAIPVLVEISRRLPSAILFRRRVQDVSGQPSAVVRIPKGRAVTPVARSTCPSRQRLSTRRRDLRPGLARRRDSRSR